MTKISVIIPHYNCSDRLEILLSTIPVADDIEIIIVDDHSDGTHFQRAQELSDQRSSQVHFLRSTSQNKGAGAARNVALDLASGRYLLFADADDFFLIDNKPFYAIRQHLDSDWDLLVFPPTSLDLITRKTTNRHLSPLKVFQEFEKEEDKNVFCRSSVPWSKLIKRQLVVDHNIRFEEIIASNDKMFSLKVAYHAQKVSSLKHTIYCVTKGPEGSSLTQTKTLPILKARFNAAIRCNQFRAEVGLPLDRSTYYLRLAYKSNKAYFFYILAYSMLNKYPYDLHFVKLPFKRQFTRIFSRS